MKPKAIRSILALVLLVGLVLAVAPVPAARAVVLSSTWTVNAALANDTKCISAVRLCKTIQAAVTAATAGDTIVVFPGTYTEQVDISKDLTVTGAGASSIIKSPPTLVTKFTTSSDKKPVVYIHGATVTLMNLKVDGDGTGNANYGILGVAFHNAGGKADRLTIVGVRETPLNGNQHGVGLYAYNQDSTSRSLVVSNNTISDFQKNGMALTGAGLSVVVRGNTVTGAGPTAVTAQNGIQVSYGAVGTVGPGNSVSGISYTGSGWSASAILIYQSDVDVKNNTVSNGQVGISVVDGNTTVSGNTVTASKAGTGTTYWGIDIADTPSAKPSPYEAENEARTPAKAAGLSATKTAVVSDNVVTGGGALDDPSSVGIEADAGYYGADNIAFTATGNKVSGWGFGVAVSQCESSCTGGLITSIAINYNSISGNAVGADSNVVATNAEKNWWGCAAGPGQPGCDLVTDTDVDYTPWAGALVSSVTASTHELGETATLDTKPIVNGLYGAQLRVSHDNSILSWLGGTHNDVLGAAPPWQWDLVQENFVDVASPNGKRLTGAMHRSAHTVGANLTGSDSIATWRYTCSAPGTSSLTYETGLLGTKLSDVDSFEIPAALLGDSITCVAATADVSGAIQLQGRLSTSPSPQGWNDAIVTFNCTSGACTGSGPYIFVTGADGQYSLVKGGVPGAGIALGNYTVTAARHEYLGASKSVTIGAGSNSIATPKLLGGDATNNGSISIEDLSCVGGAFGTTGGAMGDCSGLGSPDINEDGVDNIFDLVLVAGNYGQTSSIW
jgi:parallel beta-helix repeat protein